MNQIIRSLLFFLLLLTLPLRAEIRVLDDVGNAITLSRPAQRIVTVAPHAMELVYAAGGLSRIAGKSSHSHYPPTARAIPEIGDNRQIDVERVLALKPDLLVAWQHGVSQRQLDRLRQYGIAVYISDPRRLADIPDSIERLATLLGTEKRAAVEAKRLRRKLAWLRGHYGQRKVVSVFYQVSDRPLYTLNDQHIIGEAIRLCGGTNVFGMMKTLAPQVGIEAVLAANPDAIIHTSVDPQGDGLAFWKRYPMLKAVRSGHLSKLNPDLLDRPGPRMVDGVERLCEAIDKAR